MREQTTYGHLNKDGVLVRGLELTREECEVLKFIKQQEKKLDKLYRNLYKDGKAYKDPLNVCSEGD